MSIRSRKAQAAQDTPTMPSSAKLTNNDDLVNTIRRVFKEEFEVHENKINDIIKINMEAVNSGSRKFLRKLMKLRKASNSPKTSLTKNLPSLKAT